MQKIIRLNLEDVVTMVSERYNVEPDFIKTFVGRENDLLIEFPDTAIGKDRPMAPKCHLQCQFLQKKK